jgi:predicted pyridoxine 5'-phosphate oxidase superfamily flavin-nucleotide-binding protein
MARLRELGAVAQGPCPIAQRRAEPRREEVVVGILSEDMQRVIAEQRLGFVATVCPDGTPNLSPKGTTAVWDGDHLVFADIRSPQTVENLRHNPALEINVVDPFARTGYRFKGTATLLTAGPLFEGALAFFRERGTNHPIRTVVLVRVTRALPLVSPAYDRGMSEAEVRLRWEAHYESLRRAAAAGGARGR